MSAKQGYRVHQTKVRRKLTMNFKPNMLFLNRSFDKKRLKALLLWFRLNLSENAALKAVEILQGLGFRSATQGAISLGLDDLKTPTSKGGRVFQAQVEVALAHHEHHRGNRTPVELFQHLVDTWHRTSQDLTTEVVQLFHSTERVNPVYMMAFSGARGNISQVRQLVGMRGLMADPRGQIVGFPILSNFREGLTITEYFVSCYGARKGVVDTAIRTADAGYLTRRLADVSHHVVVRTTNCGTHESILLRDIKEGQKTILSLANRLVGRVLAEHIFLPTSPGSDSIIESPKGLPNYVVSSSFADPFGISEEKLRKPFFADILSEGDVKHVSEGSVSRKLETLSKPLLQRNTRIKALTPKGLAKQRDLAKLNFVQSSKTIIYRNSEITSSLASKLAEHYLEIPVRSPLSCSLPWGVCQLCYGWGLSEGRRVTLGEAVGIIAAQSIGEPGTQLTLRTFHTGGVFSGELLNEIRAPYSGNVIFPIPLQGLLLRTPHGQIAFLTKVSGKMKISETEMHFASKIENLDISKSIDCVDNALHPKDLLTKSIESCANPSRYPKGFPSDPKQEETYESKTKLRNANYSFSDVQSSGDVKAQHSQILVRSNPSITDLTSNLSTSVPLRGKINPAASDSLPCQGRQNIGVKALTPKEVHERLACEGEKSIAEKVTAQINDKRSQLCLPKQDSEFLIQPSTVIFVKQKEHVINNQLLAEFSSSTLQSVNDQIEITQQVLSETAGQIWFKDIEYGNRKGPGSGSLGTYFSSQKLGGIWVLAGKPMASSNPIIDTNYSFADIYTSSMSDVNQGGALKGSLLMPSEANASVKQSLISYASPSKTTNFLRTQRAYVRNWGVSNKPLKSFIPLVTIIRGKQKLQKINLLTSSISKKNRGFPIRTNGPIITLPSAVTLNTKTKVSSSYYIYTSSMSDVKAQPTENKTSLHKNCNTHLVFNNFLLSNFSRYSKFPKINESPLKRKYLFKYHTYGIQNRLKRSINTRYAKTSTTPLINLQNNYGALKYNYVLGYSQAISSKSHIPSISFSCEALFQHNIKSLLPVKIKRHYKSKLLCFARIRMNAKNSFITSGKVVIGQLNSKEKTANHLVILTFSELCTSSFASHREAKNNLSVAKKRVSIPLTTELCQGIQFSQGKRRLAGTPVYTFQRGFPNANYVVKPFDKFSALAAGYTKSSNSFFEKTKIRLSITDAFASLGINKVCVLRNGKLPLLTSPSDKMSVKNLKNRTSVYPEKLYFKEVKELCSSKNRKTKICDQSKKLDILPLLSEIDLVTFAYRAKTKGVGHKSDFVLKNSSFGVLENVISLPPIPVLPSLAPYFNKTSFSFSASLSSFNASINSLDNKSIDFADALRTCETKKGSSKRLCVRRKATEGTINLSTSQPTTYSKGVKSKFLTVRSSASLKGLAKLKNKTDSLRMPLDCCVSQGNKSSYFVTEKRRLQGAWIQKKRAYLTYLHQICSIPFTQQFTKGTKGYTAEAFTNFISRTNLQLSMFSVPQPTTYANQSVEVKGTSSLPRKIGFDRVCIRRNGKPLSDTCKAKKGLAKLEETHQMNVSPLGLHVQPAIYFKGVKGKPTPQRPPSGFGLAELRYKRQESETRINKRFSFGYVQSKEGVSEARKNTSIISHKIYPGQLVAYGDNIANNVVTTESGQVLYIDSQKTTVRKAQTVLIYSQAIIAVLSGDWIKKGTPLMSLSYQKLVTGDIVQGLPKIEQFFEAPVLRDGTFWSDSLQAKLNQFFQEEREKLPLAEAVRKSFSEIQRVLVEGVLRVYISQGVLIADKHLEVIVRQMTCKGRILYSGDTGFLRNELVSLDKIENVNQVTYGQKALYHPQVRGITDASLESESFLSAASFQETTRVLSRDAIIGKTDLMRGLKERVIVGELIQAGTGLANNSVYNLLTPSFT